MEQAKALALLKSGRNVFLTGSAGTGKTYVLNEYIKYLKDRKVGVAVTASTGIAASHMDGQTIHSWSGIGVKNSFSEIDLKSMSEKKWLMNKFEDSQVLIIDEISMLHRNQIEMVDKILQEFKEPFQPFGGMQVIVSGDFFQLPPVTRVQESDSAKFAFMSPSWVDAAFKVCYLTQQFRQGKNELNAILNEIRAGDINERSYFMLKETYDNVIKDESSVTRLYTHNKDVDAVNNHFLQQLDAEVHVFDAKLKGKEALAEGLKRSVLAPDKLAVKMGARVMFVRNNYEKNFLNGTLGEVIDFGSDGYPIVKTLSGDTIKAEPEIWAIEDEKGKVLAAFEQVPLRLAWAITVHKSQGMTLDAAVMDLSKTFEKGQGYVALSRLKDLNGLQLLGFNNRALEVNSLAAKADRRFMELSNEVDMQTNLLDLEKDYIPFLKRVDGLTSEIAIEKNAKKRAEKKRGKKSTYLITVEYIEKKQSLEQIAKERGLSERTIAGHLVRLSRQIPDLDLSIYKPENAMLDKITRTVEKLIKSKKDDLYTDEGNLKMSPIYYALNEKVDYIDIQLATIFLPKQLKSNK